MRQLTIVYALAVLVAAAVGWRGVARRLSALQVAARVVLVLYVGWVIGATLFPIPLHWGVISDGPATQSAPPNLVPFRTIRQTLALQGVWTRVRLLGGNVCVFVPFGLLMPLIFPRLASLRRMALAGLLFSLAIELSQLAVSLAVGSWYRMTDVDDVMLNVVGVLLGYALFRRFVAPTDRGQRFGT
jgi:glycopeptide antibiotics resistance protein